MTRDFHQEWSVVYAVLRIRDVYPGSEPYSIPDPGSKKFPDTHPHQIKYFNPVFLSSWKYDPGCSSWVRILILPIPDPGVKKAPDHGSATLGVCLTNNERLRYLPPAVVAGRPPLQPL
jgi:hypothetical protein